MNNFELISIVVPVYNVERYLERCVNSILSQRYKNLEIILVNDGSTDNSGNLCDELSKLDNRIVVYHKENGGLSDARNYGVERAKGQYIGFVDSDDYIHENMYAHLYEIIKKEDADVSECGVTRVYKNAERPHYTGEEYYLVLNAKEYLREYLTIEKIYGNVCWKLIKKDIAKKIMFPVGKYYEDMFYNYELMQLAKKYVIINNSYYYYYIRENSITTKHFNDKHLVILEIATKIYDYTIKNYPEYSEEAITRLYYAYVSLISQLVFVKNYKNIKEYKFIKKFIIDNKNKIFLNSTSPKTLKIAVALIIINTNLYKYILKLRKTKLEANI